jgi:hypothetical protein
MAECGRVLDKFEKQYVICFVLWFAALNDVLFNDYSKHGYRYKTDRGGFDNITLGRAAKVLCLKLTLALLTAPVQLRRCIKLTLQKHSSYY